MHCKLRGPYLSDREQIRIAFARVLRMTLCTRPGIASNCTYFFCLRILLFFKGTYHCWTRPICTYFPGQRKQMEEFALRPSPIEDFRCLEGKSESRAVLWLVFQLLLGYFDSQRKHQQTFMASLGFILRCKWISYSRRTARGFGVLSGSQLIRPLQRKSKRGLWKQR